MPKGLVAGAMCHCKSAEFPSKNEAVIACKICLKCMQILRQGFLKKAHHKLS